MNEISREEMEIEELRRLLEEIPEIADEGRKKYMIIDLVDRIRKVCFAHPSITSHHVQRENLTDVAKRIFYIRHEFGDDAVDEMLKASIKFLLSEYGQDSKWRKRAITSIKSAFNEQKNYLMNLLEDTD